MDENIAIPKAVRDMITPAGFLSAYFKNLDTAYDNREAYETTEREYIKYFGRRRYSNFESFRICKNRRILGK